MPKIQQLCGVCGDIARCVNYGGATCEPCKSFFRRSHYNNIYRNYYCKNGSNCIISKETKKSCPYCRFQRCLRNGMNSKLLKSDKDKADDLAKRRSRNTSVVPQTEIAIRTKLEDKSKFFNSLEILELENLYSKYAYSFHDIPYTEETLSLQASVIKAAAVLTETLQRVFFYCFLIPQFRELDLYDQVVLVSKGASDLGLLNAALGYDEAVGCWPRKDCNYYRTVRFTKKDLEAVIGPEQASKEVQYILSIQRLRPDEPLMMLVFILVLFNPGRGDLRNPVKIAKHQMYFARLLKNYSVWRYGAAEGQNLFEKLVAKITELRMISGVIDGITNFCELHPELHKMKCCKAFFALTFSKNNLCMEGDAT